MPGPSLYVYAIAGEPIRVDDLSGIAGERLLAVSAGPCHAIAGEMTISHHIDATADTLRAQDALVRQLASRAEALLPARFGSRFDDEAAVRQSLDTLTPRLEQALARVRGCEQMTIRLFTTVAAPATVTASATAAAGPDAGREAGPGTQYMLRRAAEARDATAALDRVRAHVAAHVKDERIEHGRPPVIGSIHHLIPRGTSDAYRARLDELAAASAIRMRISGPSPAYAFAEATP